MPLILQSAFRPFFLLAGLAAAGLIPWWLGGLAGHLPLPDDPGPVAWHVHEMLFGFVGAALGGFLLTATPNWTGTRPHGGAVIALLAAAWLAGRLAVAAGGTLPAGIGAGLALAYPLLLWGLIARVILGARGRRHHGVLALLGLWLLAAAGVQAARAGPWPAGPWPALDLGLYAVVGLMLIITGRIGPAFTAGHLRQQGRDLPLSTPAWAEWAWPPLLGLLAGADLLGRPLAAGLAALALSAVLALRMAGWRTAAVRGAPMVLVLHVGHGWLVLGALLLGVAHLGGPVAPSAGLHALLAGGAGTLAAGVMTRASLGHTGRPIAAGPATVACHGLITLAALARVAAALPVAGAAGTPLLHLSGGAWTAAFALFLLAYGPLLLRPRADGRPG